MRVPICLREPPALGSTSQREREPLPREGANTGERLPQPDIISLTPSESRCCVSCGGLRRGLPTAAQGREGRGASPPVHWKQSTIPPPASTSLPPSSPVPLRLAHNANSTGRGAGSPEMRQNLYRSCVCLPEAYPPVTCPPIPVHRHGHLCPVLYRMTAPQHRHLSPFLASIP